MARYRTIKPEIWVSEQVGNCSRDARLTFIGLLNFCDDRGVHPAKAKTLKAEVFPQDDDVTSAMVSAWVGELLHVGLLVEFAADGATYWHVTGWAKHQRIDRPSNKHPAPPPVNSASIRRVFDEDAPNDRRGVADQSDAARGSLGHGVELKGVELSGEDVSVASQPPRRPKADGQQLDESSMNRQEPSSTPPEAPTGRRQSLPACNYEGIVAAYHDMLPLLPAAKVRTTKREAAVRKRWQWVLTEPHKEGAPRATNAAEAMSWFVRFFKRAQDNDFIMGRTPRSPGHENWRADLDFLLSDKGLVQVVEKTEVSA